MPCRSFTLADFDFELPPELIAQHPARERSGSRLLDGRGRVPVDRVFADLPQLLQSGDLLVFNDTRVIKARLFGEKASGGAVQALVERVLPGHEVLAHLRASKSPKAGSRLRFADAFDAEVLGRAGPDDALFHLRFPADPLALLQAHGHVPLPPYITHEDAPEDEARYQTVFAARPGAVAAPTAALHFDEALLQALEQRGIRRAAVTLHVGAGTFQPVRSENLAEHRMHSEWFEVGEATVAGHRGDTRRRRAHRRHRHDHAARTGIGCPPRRAACRRGRDRHLHHPGLRVPRGGPAGHQLPPAQEHADDAGQRLCRPRTGDGAVPACDRGALPLLQLRRRNAAVALNPHRGALRQSGAC
jgi:S-adenosylmethionine:tRNA ribosyltransferase-isomerase